MVNDLTKFEGSCLWVNEGKVLEPLVDSFGKRDPQGELLVKIETSSLINRLMALRHIASLVSEFAPAKKHLSKAVLFDNLVAETRNKYESLGDDNENWDDNANLELDEEEEIIAGLETRSC